MNIYSKIFLALSIFFALGTVSASAACVKAIAGVGYQAKVRWINDSGNTVKTEIVRLGQRKCGPSNHVIAIRTQGAALAKGATIVFGSLATTVANAGACVQGPISCKVATTLNEAAIGAFIALPGKNDTFYYAKPRKKNVCLTGSVFSPSAKERNGKKKRHCKKGT